jgi:NAD(P)H-dependent nitrite reductase small subunit
MSAANATLDSCIWEEVCAVDELIDNIGVCALVGDEQVAIFKLTGGDTLYAISNHDPFSDVNVLSRGVVGDLKGEAVVASPIYKQHFNLKTGHCVEDMNVRLKTYPVRVVDGMVQVASNTDA